MTVDINIKMKMNNGKEIKDNKDNSLKVSNSLVIILFKDADKYEIDTFIPTRKTFSLNLNPNEKVINLFQHRVHNNKYFIISIDNGNIL